MSRGFISALVGIAMTIFSWYGPWSWPAWPAYTVMAMVRTNFADLPYLTKGAFVVLLIIVNVGVWATIAYGLLTVARRRT